MLLPIKGLKIRMQYQYFDYTEEQLLMIRSPETSLVTQTVKNLYVMGETWVQSLGREDPLEKGMATHSSILDRRISWTEEPGRLQFMGSKQVSDMIEQLTHLSRPPDGAAEDNGSDPSDKLMYRITNNQQSLVVIGSYVESSCILCLHEPDSTE